MGDTNGNRSPWTVLISPLLQGLMAVLLAICSYVFVQQANKIADLQSQLNIIQTNLTEHRTEFHTRGLSWDDQISRNRASIEKLNERYFELRNQPQK